MLVLFCVVSKEQWLRGGVLQQDLTDVVPAWAQHPASPWALLLQTSWVSYGPRPLLPIAIPFAEQAPSSPQSPSEVPAGFARVQPSTGNQHGPFWPPNLITKPLKTEPARAKCQVAAGPSAPHLPHAAATGCSPHPAPRSLPRAASSPQLRLKAVGDRRNPAAGRGRDIIRAARLSALLLLPCKFTPRSLALHRSKSATAETRGVRSVGLQPSPGRPTSSPSAFKCLGCGDISPLQKPFLGLCSLRWR